VLLQSTRITRAVTLAPILLREPVACDGFEGVELRDASPERVNDFETPGVMNLASNRA